MNKSFVWIVTGCIGMVLCVGCAGPEEKAGKLLAEASQLVHLAQEAEKTSYSDAFELYQKALIKAETIPAQYPSTQLAGKLAQGEAKVGPYTLAELKGTIVPRARMKAEAGENPLACALLVAQTIEETISRANIMTEIATTYADAGQLDQVLQILETTRDKESRSRVLSEMVSRYLNPEHYDLALRIAHSVKDSAQRDWALAWIVRDAASRGQYDKAIEVANTLEVAGSKAEALIQVAGYCLNAGQREKAVEILSQALKVAKTVDNTSRKDWALGQIARGYAEAGQHDQALEVTGKIVDSTEKTEALAGIARKHMQAGHYDQAVKVALTIADPSVQYRTLADITDASIASGDKAKTNELLSQLLQAASAIEERPLLEGRMRRSFPRRRSPLDTMQGRPIKARALAEVASKYAKIGEKGKATELLSQALTDATAVTDTLRKADALAEIARTSAAVGEYEQALQITNTISDPYVKEKALAAIASNYAEIGQYDQALQIAQAIESAGFKADVLATIARQYVKAGQLDQARQLAETIPDHRLGRGVLADIADAYAKAGHQEQAASLFSRIEDRRDAHWEERYAVMVGMVALYARAGLYDPALRIANLIGDEAEKASALATVARRFAEAGQKEKAAEILFHALEAAKTVEEKTDPDLSMLPGIALQYADIGQCSQAVEIAGIIRDAQSRVQTVAEIAVKCETGQQEKAATATEEKTTPEITGAHAETGHYDQDLQVARAMEDSPAKTEALLAIARKYAEAGATEKAAEISLQALRVANSVEDDSEGMDAAWVKGWALSQVADEYLEDEQYDQALVVAKTMKDGTPKAGVLAGVASKYAKAGAQERAAELLSQALRIAKTRQEAEAKAQALTAIGFPYAKAGLKVDDGAKRILHDMVAELGESPWREQPSEAEDQRTKRRGWGIVGADVVP
jgi:tetratricopeptide (TPR) repeat protein